jgi:hypothetical protein
MRVTSKGIFVDKETKFYLRGGYQSIYGQK